jgi:hypothetical protein
MSTSPIRPSAPRLATLLRRYAVIALFAVSLTYALVPSSAQRRTAVRIPAGEAAPTLVAPRREHESPQEKAEERRRVEARARARMKARQRDGVVAGGLPVRRSGETVGVPWTGAAGVERTTADIMQAEANSPNIYRGPRLMREREMPDRRSRPQNPRSKAVASTTTTTAVRGGALAPEETTTTTAPQTVGTQFTGATLADSAFPPDTMGAVGPSQFVVFVNNRIRTFNKTTGAADGVINADADVFFASVMTTGVTFNFTSDPNVRYDRLSGRWILTIIDVPSVSFTGDTPNRILIAVSDAASANALSNTTVWTFYFVQQNTVGGGDSGEFLDYPSLGLDNNALYIGGNMFDAAIGDFITTSAFVIRKSSILSGGPVVTTAFRQLIVDPNNFDEGPLSPRGVDNFSPTATEGYFIGASDSLFGELVMRRVSTPGATPTISADILVPVSTTFSPVIVDHLGNTNVADTDLDGFADGDLDALDDRLFAAHIRNGRLWTAHNIAVNTAGAASSGTQRRNGVRWYELNVPVGAGTPTVTQSGTVFDSAATRATARQYFIPSIMVSGQGHAALGYSTSGTTFRADAATSGRLRTDTLGTTGAVALYTASSTAYNPPGDNGTPPNTPRRWGDYSFTSLDPKDDMTMWTIQQFCDAANSYGVRVAKLNAPPPATPNGANPASVPPGASSVLVTITGTSISGSEFYDPGTNLAAPAVAFNHITATVSGGVTVNSITYTDPTHVTLDLNTTAAPNGAKTITITNPDGQSTTGGNAVFVGIPPSSPLLISEFRFRGPASAADEYVELYNNTNAALDISGYTLWALTGAGAQNLRFTAPGTLGSNTTVIPARGHYLITGASYTLAAYAASNGALSTGIVDGSGIAVFAGATTAATRLDSVGFDTRDGLFFEGTALSPSSNTGAGGIVTPGEYAFVRKMTTASGGLPRDTDNNQSDFSFVSITGGVFSTRQSTLGAPGPENLASPIQRNGTFALTLLDPAVGSASSPNRERNLTSDPPNNSQFGTMSIRRTLTNNTGASVTRVRFRIVDITTAPAPAGAADLRARTSTPPPTITITGPNAACPANVCPMVATTLETPPTQPSGGGLNSSLAVGTITLGTPLANGLSVNVEFLLGVQQTGTFRFFVNIEALP